MFPYMSVCIPAVFLVCALVSLSAWDCAKYPACGGNIQIGAETRVSVRRSPFSPLRGTPLVTFPSVPSRSPDGASLSSTAVVWLVTLSRQCSSTSRFLIGRPRLAILSVVCRSCLAGWLPFFLPPMVLYPHKISEHKRSPSLLAPGRNYLLLFFFTSWI